MKRPVIVETQTPAERQTLEYILSMIDELAEMAGGIGESQLGSAIRGAAELRRSCDRKRTRETLSA